VLVVPDGSIGLVAFAALPWGAAGYLVEGGPTLHYLSAERDLLRPLPTDTPRSLLALGGPDYDEVLGAAADRPSSAPKTSAAAAKRPTADAPACEARGPLVFPFLPHAAAEATEVARLWERARAGDRLRLLVGREASERALKLSASSNAILHLATHSFFRPSECTPVAAALRGGEAETEMTHVLSANPLFQSGLALAGANRPADVVGGEDGLLMAAEVAELDLARVEWVVLSACGSGVGRVQPGEGVLSLQRAFVIGGARTVVMSLWSVEDAYARHWSRALYESRLLHGASTSEAVRLAHLEVLTRAREALGAAPAALWAPFVASGDWR
jgi:CHAT domain-containing protein